MARLLDRVRDRQLRGRIPHVSPTRTPVRGAHLSGPAVEAIGIFKKFRRGELHDSLRDFIPSLARRLVRRGPPPELAAREFWALRDVSFAVARGEAFGILGGNGAGKSTMLKLLGGILRPTRGTLTIRGRLSALIEVSAGFHPDLTGRENIYLYGTILGMRREAIRSRFDAIVEFSGLEEFIDTPVKRYSSGMFARLGFSVAAHVDPEVLLVDEVLSVGDLVFQRRCMQRMNQVIQQGTTVLFVSHNLHAVSELCSRATYLDHGQVVATGPAADIIRQYLRANTDLSHTVEGKAVYFSRVLVRNRDGEASTFRSGETAWIDVEVVARTSVEELAVVIDLIDEDEGVVFNTSTERLGAGSFALEAGETFACTFEVTLHLARGTFRVATFLHRYDVRREFDRLLQAATILVSSVDDVRGIANLYPRIVRFGKDDGAARAGLPGPGKVEPV